MYQKVSINLNNACNLRCTYCFVSKQPQYMSRETADSLIAMLPTMALEAHFFGTEPLLSWPVMRQIVEALPGMAFGVTTNGTLVNKRNAKWMANHLAGGVLLSCDGDGKHTARQYANGRSAHDKIIRGWDILVEQGVIPAIAATVTPDNLDWLLEDAQFLLSRPQKFVHFNFDTTFGKWDSRKLHVAWQRLADWYYTEKPAGIIRNFHPSQQKNKQLATRATCGACHGSIGIDWDGTLYPCHRTNLPSIGKLLPRAVEYKPLVIDQFKRARFNECYSCPANPCSTCYSNFEQVTGSPFKINREWCKVQLTKWNVQQQYKDRSE